MCWPPRIVHPNGAYFTKTRQTQVNNERATFSEGTSFGSLVKEKENSKKMGLENCCLNPKPVPPSLTSTKQTICFLSLELASRHLASRHLSSKITPPTLPDRSRKPCKEKEDRFFYVLLFITKIQKTNFRLISLEFSWVGGIVHTFVTHFMSSRDPEYCPQPKQDND